MGAANVIPGVSGGTVAFITGIYERLISAIKSFDLKALGLLKKRKIADFCKHIDFIFLCVLGGGVMVSILTLAQALEWAYESYEVYTSSLFFGLIALSIYSVAKMVKKWSLFCAIAAFLGASIAVLLAFIEQGGENENIFYLMLCGAVAMCSMILPGVSGSFVLILMGNYFLILNSVNDLRRGAFNEALPIILPIGIGAVIGVAVLSRFLSWLFKKYYDITTALITGFITGSLFVIWPWKLEKTKAFGEKIKVIGYERYLPNMSDETTYIALFCIIIGAVIMFVMELLGSKKNALKG